MIAPKSRKRKSYADSNDKKNQSCVSFNFNELTKEEKIDWKQIYEIAFSWGETQYTYWGEQQYTCSEPETWHYHFFNCNSSQKRSKKSIVNWLVNESKIRTGYEHKTYFNSLSDENDELWNVAHQMLKNTSFKRLIQQINNSKRSSLDTWYDQGDDASLYRGIFLKKIKDADLNILFNALEENSLISISNLKFPIFMTIHYDNFFCLRWITGTMKYNNSKCLFHFKWCLEKPSFISKKINPETGLTEWYNAMIIEWLPSINSSNANCVEQLIGIDRKELKCDWPQIENLEFDGNTIWAYQNITHPLVKKYAFLGFPLNDTLTKKQILIRLDPLYWYLILKNILLVPLINMISEYLFELSAVNLSDSK